MYRPLIYTDLPDPDVICVGDTYYMVSTTMHMFPGGDIYRSKDLLRWELCCHMYDRLDETPAQKMEAGNIYGQGMWAACIRHHKGRFHVFFVCNDTRRAYHFTAEAPEGPWKYQQLQGFYHDCSVLFEEDRAYIVYGNRSIWLTELNDDLSGPRAGGIHQQILRDLPEEEMMLGYEGSHFYKINGKYRLFLIHWPRGGMRTEAYFESEQLTGPYTGGDVLCSDMGFHGQGVAQGGIVQGPDGKWHGLLFQDRGAVGRVPVLCDVQWCEDRPVFSVAELPAEADIRALYAREEPFREKLSPMWQFNHQPDDDACQTGPGGLMLKLHRADSMEQARNTLTQRAFGPKCTVSVTVDGSRLRQGGRAGLGVLQGCFAGAYIERTETGFVLGSERRTARKAQLRSDEPVQTQTALTLEAPVVRLTMEMDFTDLADTVRLFADLGAERVPIGSMHRLQYRLDHFMGARIALYGYDTQSAGSCALFRDYACRIEP